MKIDKDIEDATETSTFAWDSVSHFHEQVEKKIAARPWRGLVVYVSDDVAYKVGDMAQDDKRFQAGGTAEDGYICHYRKIPVLGTVPGRFVPPGMWMICWFHGEQ